VSASPAGTYSYSVTNGTLPAGLMLNAASGAITGTPTMQGTFNLTVTASSGACAGSRSYTVTIGCAGIAFTTASPLTAGQVGVAYSQTLGVAPVGSYGFSLTTGNLPGGLTLHPTTGVLSGTPGATGSFAFTVKAQAANGCNATQTYTLVIGCPAVSLTPTSLPAGATGAAYNQPLSTSPAGGNYVYAVTTGSLPAGLTLNSATGVLSGTPTANGTFNFTVTATGFGACSGNRAYTIVIGGGCPTITLPALLPGGSVGQLYSQSVAASPAGSYSYTFTGTLPPGVTLFGSFGLLYGFPTANGTYNFNVTATGSNNCSATQSYSVVIGAGNAVAAVNDFNGDRKSDFVLRRAEQTQWLIVDGATNAVQTLQWGQAGDQTLGGDFDGDGKADLAGFGKDGHWRVKLSGGGTLDKLWGLASDTPVPGDYDGDGKTDLAVWRGTETNWYILRSSDGQTMTVTWGSSLAPYNDLAVPGDYDGDGKTDIAVFRQASGKDGGHWYVRRSSDGKVVDKAWGQGTDVPVPADFDGDGKTDIAVWRGSEGNWYIVRSSDGTMETKFWGAAFAPYFDVPAVGDYDGDGKADAAVWRSLDNSWYVLQSSDGASRIVKQSKTANQ
ncbi:MAG TPA: putative Ig domain-containing protein, partial [Blastocatellia bacterium]|nr:putative Ig domain-containing protein [Blastocatellia bacterium]